ncbi:MAG: hypothetical protein WB586_26890, partial [Chthoniobacterales bacterium]
MKIALPAGCRSAEFGTWMIVGVLATPSFFLLFACPPLWRDTDGFNQIASTFAPMGIIHWLPGYCFFGRLIMIVGGVAGSLLTGHGIPYLSIGTPTLNDAGIYSLITFQHAFLVASLWYLIEVLTDRFWLKLVFAGFLVFTPWLYLFAHCIGSEAFSNPLVILTIAAGWRCIKLPNPSRRNTGGFFLFLLLAALTRQINALLAVAVPLTLLITTGICRIRAFAGTPNAKRRTPNTSSRWEFFARKCAVFLGLSLLALVGAIAVQVVMCWAFRVPYRTTFGRTFEWRLRYLASLSADDRTRLFNRFSSELKDPMLSSALFALNDSLVRDPDWKALFLFQNLDSQLEAAGETNQQVRAYQADLKLNRLARHFLLPPEANYVRATWTDVKKAPFVSQSDLSRSPFYTTTALQNELQAPRYTRLRSLATFQFDSSFFIHRWEQGPYFHALGWVPLIALAGAAILFTVARWVFVPRDGEILVGTVYVGTLIVTGGLFTFANCASTNFDARYLLPVYSCFQIALMLSVSMIVVGESQRHEVSANWTVDS